MDSRVEPSFVQFLRLLGFPTQEEGTSKPLLTADLFLLPNRDAFQKVLYFLFQTYDAEKCSNELRDCWPIIEKKQEAEFRRNLFSWYKDLQAENPDSLPQITASLFQSPGGRKFLHFISCLVRFIAVRQIKKQSENPVFWDININKIKSASHLANKILPQLISENNKVSRQIFMENVEKQNQGQEVLDSMTNIYRDVKSKIKGLAEANESRTPGTGSSKVLEQHIAVLSEECRTKQSKAQKLRDDFNEVSGKFCQIIDQIESVLSHKQDGACLDVRAVKTAQDSNIGQIFEKLFDQSQSIEADIVEFKRNIESQVAVERMCSATEHSLHMREKYKGMRFQLAENLLPSLEKLIVERRALTNSFDWHKAAESVQFGERAQFAVPPSPGVQIIEGPRKDFMAKSFLLESGNISKLVEPSKQTMSDSGPKLDSSSRESWKNPENTGFKSVNEPSDHLQIPDLTRLKKISLEEESKWSVFSPILSSSRFEKSNNSANLPAIKEKASSSFLFSDPGAFHSKMDVVEHATPNRVEKAEASNSALEVPSFKPFCLSPSILADTTPNRRDSGLAEFISQLEKPAFDDISPYDSDRKIRSRLNDLMSTLSFSPTHTLLSEDYDSFLQCDLVDI